MEGTLKKTISKLAAFVAMLALAATPALAAGPPSDVPAGNQGTANKPDTPGPKAGLPAKAKAYGRYCQNESKKRSDAAEGTKGTPFSQCVTAMAKLAKDKTDSPRKACKTLSKERAEGAKGSPFSICVKGGAKLLREQKAQND
ncbi:MAG TPA: hypothetical protein VK307_05420 [Thermoleophilaceae bacterium]|nr:hypothetical protein [Thermoleophilaceae bacterium]